MVGCRLPELSGNFLAAVVFDQAQPANIAGGVCLIEEERSMAVINGSSQNETIAGTGEDDVIHARGGDDRVKGRRGDDDLFGQNGDDKLFGGGGDDTLDGGNGDDRLTGGPGDDTYVFLQGEGSDRITDFEAGKFNDDVIDLSDFGFTSIRQLKQATFNSGGDVIIELDAHQTLTLANISEAELHFRSDFII
jgi:Ca2+-binding RTX toxin-like protein